MVNKILFLKSLSFEKKPKSLLSLTIVIIKLYYLINVTFPPNFSIFSFADFEIEFTSMSNFCFKSPLPSNFNFLYFLFINLDFCKLGRFILLLSMVFCLLTISCILDKLISAIFFLILIVLKINLET